MNENLTHGFAHSGNENGIWTTLKLKRLIVSENMNSIFFADISRSFFQCFRRSNQSSLQSFSRNISWNEKRIVKMPRLKLIVVEFGNISWSHGVATIPRKFRLTVRQRAISIARFENNGISLMNWVKCFIFAFINYHTSLSLSCTHAFLKYMRNTFSGLSQVLVKTEEERPTISFYLRL